MKESKGLQSYNGEEPLESVDPNVQNFTMGLSDEDDSDEYPMDMSDEEEEADIF